MKAAAIASSWIWGALSPPSLLYSCCCCSCALLIQFWLLHIHSFLKNIPCTECCPHPHLGLRRLPALLQPCWFSQSSHPWQIFWSRRTPLTHLLDAIYNMLWRCPNKVLVVKSISIWAELHESETSQQSVISPAPDCRFLLVLLSPIIQRILVYFFITSLSPLLLHFTLFIFSPHSFCHQIPSSQPFPYYFCVCVCARACLHNHGCGTLFEQW